MKLNIKVSKKRNMKNFILKVTPEREVKLSAPINATKKSIDDFIQKNIDWIANTLEKVNQKLEKEKDTIYYLGKKYSIKFVDSEKTDVIIKDDNICIYGSTEDKNRILGFWFQKQLAEIIKEMSFRIGEKVGYYPNEIKIKTMKSRWGSCISSRRVTTYNLKLISKPLPVIEYVVLHELAHIPYPNHQKEFWDFVEKFMPDWKDRRKMLKEEPF